ncbi:retrovirus-related pol polyprotein from transposon TNT 1-94 [Tanacetum coccineum]
MSSNSDDIQAVGSDTRPPMLDRTDYDSWSQRILLYYRGKENGIYILQSIDHGPFELRTTRDTLGTTPEGGLPKDIYKLINHNIEAKSIWDNVKMLLARSELTKEDRESQLYNEFERFKMLPGENINEYYVRFHKLVNDMRNIRMTMPNIQLNSKSVNTMSPEWDRFVTVVKLNKGLKETNHEQLYTYLKQHEKHVAQDRLIIEKITLTTNDQLAFVSIDGKVVVHNVQGQQNQNQRNSARGAGAAGNGGAQNRAGNANAVLDEEELLFLDDKCDAFDSDVDDEPTAQSIFMASLSSARPVNLQAGPSNASILSEVHYLDNAIDPSNNDQVEHEIYNEVQQKNVIDSTSADMGNSNVIPYEQYLTVNDVSVVPSSASFVPNDAYVLHDNDAYVPHDSLATELNIYKEQVAMYEQRAKFELTMHAVTAIGMHHVPVIVTSSEEDLELAETTRINEIIPPNYSKENFIATFTLQTQLTPEQVLWSNEIKEKKVEDLKARTLTLPVLPHMIVYPPNTPVHLVPRTLPTTSQVNIGLYVITQLFWDFEKTCKKRITPTGITEGESGFEQTKRCYLTEVIPFFNILKEHFDEVQKSLVKEVRAMKVVFENLEAGVDQKTQLKGKRPCVTSNVKTPKISVHENYAIDVHPLPQPQRNNRGVHHGYLNRLRDTLDTLREIVKEARSNQPSDNSLEYACVYTKHSQELLEYMNASCPKADNKRDKLIATTPLTRKKHVTFADPLETSGNNTPKHVKQQSVHQTNVPIIPSTGVSTATTARRSQPKSNTTHDKTLPTINVPKKNIEDHPRTNKSKLSKKNHVNSSISVRRTVFNTNSNSLCKTCNECIISFNHDKCVENSLKSSKPPTVKKIWRVKQVKQTWKPTCKVFTTVGYHWKPTGRIFPLGAQCPLTRNTTSKVLPVKQWKPTSRLLSLGGLCPLVRPTTLNCGTKLADPQANNTPVEYNLVVQIVLWYLDSSCSKHMTGDRSRLRNFVKKFIETVRFGNNHFGAIMGYGDYVIGDSVISQVFTWVKFLRSKDQTPEFVVKLLKQLQVSLNKTVRNVRTDNGIEFVNKDLTAYYESVGINHEKSVLRTPQQNGVVERRNRTLMEAARTMLIFCKAPMFLWAEAISTACYT